MKKMISKASRMAMRIFPALAFMLAVSSVSSTCFYSLHQPDVPAGLKKYEK